MEHGNVVNEEVPYKNLNLSGIKLQQFQLTFKN